VCEVLYDCFGDFVGFVLETCDERAEQRRVRFRACEPGIERLVLRACSERLRLRVHLRQDDAGRIAAIAVVCCCS
jgi:hypothetical protein